MPMLDLTQARRFDLHMHSTRSDGACPPEELLARCADGGLDVVALTDHDLSTALAPGPRTVNGRLLHLLAGAEVSGVHEGVEYHLLVYFPGEVPAGFADFCTDQVRERARRYEAARASLGLTGIPAADAEARDGERALTRHHLARAIVAAGHADNLRDAFARYAGQVHGHVPAMSLPYVDAIRVAREHGGLTSWAHPPMEAVKRHVATFAAAGLQGLEGYRPGVDRQHRNFYRRTARQHGLFLTAGSDWHGWHRDSSIGLFSADRHALQGFLAALAA